MGFNEKVHASLAAWYYQALTEAFGERGKQAFVHATRHYAMQRGRRMAQRAIRDGLPLTQATYNHYGEWVPSEELQQTGQSNQSAVQPDGSLRITRCPWHSRFVELGMQDAGIAYCRVLDSAISQGFNPELGYVVEQTLHTHDCCIHRLTTGPIGEGSEKGKHPAGLRDFAYHCGHSYWSYREVAAAIFGAAGEQAAARVLEQFRQEYGPQMTEVLLSFRDTNFNVCD